MSLEIIEIEIEDNRGEDCYEIVLLNRENELDLKIIDEIIKLPKYRMDILGRTYMMGDNIESAIKERFNYVKTYRLRVGNIYVSQSHIKLS